MGGKGLRLQCPSKTVSVGSVGSPGEKDGLSWLQDSPSSWNQSVSFLRHWLGAVGGKQTSWGHLSIILPAAGHPRGLGVPKITQ